MFSLYANNPNISIEGLMEHITGPDFPTGGIIYGKSGIVDAYRLVKAVCIFVVNITLREDQKRVVQRLSLLRFLTANKAKPLSVLPS